jgi:hypothetical protein
MRFSSRRADSGSAGLVPFTREFIGMMKGWSHSGFNVFCGERIPPRQKKALEILAVYVIKPSVS